MINYHLEYRERLLNSFPKTLRSDVETVLNILPFDNNSIKLVDGRIHFVDNLIHSDSFIIQLNYELLTIPYRLYLDEPDIDKESKLTNIQKTILNCIYLRHHNGYLRQRRLEKLIESEEQWIAPFTIQLLGEYVFEILEVLDKVINIQTIDSYNKVFKENPKYCQTTESRMISYWNRFYRKRFPRIRNYIGRQLMDRIKKRTHNIA